MTSRTMGLTRNAPVYMRGVGISAMPVLALPLALALAACSGGEEWSGAVYPDRRNLLVHEWLPPNTSLDACREASLRYIALREWEDADYECGLNCRPYNRAAPDGLRVCEITTR